MLENIDMKGHFFYVRHKCPDEKKSIEGISWRRRGWSNKQKDIPEKVAANEI